MDDRYQEIQHSVVQLCTNNYQNSPKTTVDYEILVIKNSNQRHQKYIGKKRIAATN